MSTRRAYQQLFLTLSTIAALLLSGPIALLAQDDQPATPDTKLFLPLIQGSASANPEVTDEAADDDAPAITEVEVAMSDIDVAASGFKTRSLPAKLAGPKVSAPPVLENAQPTRKLNPALRGKTGKRQVIVGLVDLSVAARMADNVNASAAEQQQAQLGLLRSQQAAVVQTARSLDSSLKVLGSAQKAVNVVMLEIDAAALSKLAADPAVRSINPVVDYQMALTDTVPYIGATAVQHAGFNGSGIKVAVLDSGIDYTHAEFGGAGTLEAYEMAYGTALTDTRNTTRDGLFPTARVVEGYDFVGEQWPDSDLAPDDDPIPVDTHGTHVADIIGGRLGVAPGVNLYAAKVCSSVSTSCSGVALIEAMDFALDPNGDGNLSDHVDIINMSLGSDYGIAFDDDLSQAVENASTVGVLTVAAAGNGGDKPYVAGTPAAAPSALSVAQTEVPSAILPLMEVTAPASIAGFYAAVFQPWSVRLTTIITGPVQYADGAGGNLLGCDAFTPGSLTGKIVLVNRGACNVSLKISNIGAGGGLVGIVGLVAPGDPFEFGLGGGNPNIPGFAISQADANKIKSELANGALVTVKFDPATGIPLVGHMVGSSARGPSMGTNIIKPEIGAPGASVSAVAGSGTGMEAFGGTSGATPMVAGAAALLRQAYPARSPAEIKAVLMNTGETNILNRPVFFGGDLAPITRIGGGEVRVDRALAAAAAAWNANAPTAAISFSFQDVTRDKLVLKAQVKVRNYTDHDIRYDIANHFRFANDQANDGVKLDLPDDIKVNAHSDKKFEVILTIWGEKLRNWVLNSGGQGASPAPLTEAEYDGYFILTEKDNAANQIHLPWQVLPRKAGDVTLHKHKRYTTVRNRGVGVSTVESYSLIGVSPNLPAGGAGQNMPTPDLHYVGYTTFGVEAGTCSANQSFILGFAFNTWERQTHANLPASFEVDLDIDRDGTADYAVFNLDLNGDLTDGRNVAFAQNLVTGDAIPEFFTDHDTNSANTVLYVCAEDIGLSVANLGQPIDLAASVFDLVAGVYSDEITGITIAPGGERYIGIFDDGGVGSTQLPEDEDDKLRIFNTGSNTNNTEKGLLLLYRGGAPKGKEAGTLTIKR